MSLIQSPTTQGEGTHLHTISIVIPVYQGETTLPSVIDELLPYTEPSRTARGIEFQVSEILLVHDNGPDASDDTMRALAEAHPVVRPVWLSRNFGQHAATLAGMASTGGDWIVTMDEDGQHNPKFIADMLDTALTQQASLVYSMARNPPPHGFVRNLASVGAKRVLSSASGLKNAKDFQSFRLMLGSIGRSVAAYAGPNIYLDVALGWVTKDVATCPIDLREEGDRPSGYNYKSLFGHFWRMFLTSGTRGLRAVSLLGVVAAIAGLVLTVVLVVAKLFFEPSLPSGWPSLMVALLIIGGAILISLGMIAEYIGVNVNMAMGKPLYLIVPDPAAGPLGRDRAPSGPQAGVEQPARRDG